jgi:hypothetical protein
MWDGTAFEHLMIPVNTSAVNMGDMAMGHAEETNTLVVDASASGDTHGVYTTI